MPLLNPNIRNVVTEAPGIACLTGVTGPPKFSSENFRNSCCSGQSWERLSRRAPADARLRARGRATRPEPARPRPRTPARAPAVAQVFQICCNCAWTTARGLSPTGIRFMCSCSRLCAGAVLRPRPCCVCAPWAQVLSARACLESQCRLSGDIGICERAQSSRCLCARDPNLRLACYCHCSCRWLHGWHTRDHTPCRRSSGDGTRCSLPWGP